MSKPVRVDSALDLPRLLMRRAGAVALAVLVMAVLAGLSRMDDDIRHEVKAAHTLAQTLAGLQSLSALDDTEALAGVERLAARAQTRHLQVRLDDADGRPLLSPPAAEPSPWPLQVLLQAHRLARPESGPGPVSWRLPRPDGRDWTLTLQASREGERSEALLNLLGMLGLLSLCAAGLLLAVRWNLRRALGPLQALLRAIAGIEARDAGAVQHLPVMPVRELERLAQALRHLARALDRAEGERRALGQRVITLQEDERARLARELHDEFGQQLTALQVDAAWLRRRVQGDPTAAEVVESLIGHGRHVQQHLRTVLTRLQPLPGLGDAAAAAPLPWADLAGLLQTLVDGWAGAPAPAPRVSLRLTLLGVAEADAPALPSTLALAIYRITQEALTNAARHARARQVQVTLALRRSDSGTGIDWQVADDGIGLSDPAAALRRGSGLASIKERVWALGSELSIAAAAPGAEPPGLCLRADFGLPPVAQSPNDQRSPATTLRGAPGA